ncbi:MAG TPA: hypothetical protein VFA63_05910 [Pseudonocardiaceae bacterium]|nr:hypothetical protein [Pseudonocardiaceae bacterium]
MSATTARTWTRGFARTLTALSVAVAAVGVYGEHPTSASAPAQVELASYAAAGGVAPGCKPGYVWRDARDGDGVCVTPAERDQVHIQNADTATHLPGSNGCRPGYVWRDAWDGDGVCVTPGERDLAHQQNLMASLRSLPPAPAPQNSPGSAPGPQPTSVRTVWNVGGSWRIRQGDDTFINLEIDQAGANFTGTATYPGGSGPLHGSVSGNTMTFIVTWTNQSVGVYTGVIEPSVGYIRNGVTYDQKNRSSTASWLSLAKVFHQQPI